MSSGLRMYSKPDLNENDNDDDDKNDDHSPYFDRSFSRISNFIENSKDATNRFTRLNGNKFNISVVDDDVFDNINDDNYTFLDIIYKHLLLNNNPFTYLLKEIIESEEYDTDSVDIDLDTIKCGISNISLALNDDKNLIINR